MTYQAHCCAYISLRNERHLRIFSYKPNLTRRLSAVVHLLLLLLHAAIAVAEVVLLCVFSVFCFFFLLSWHWSWQWQHGNVATWQCEGVICYLFMPQRVASCVALITCCLAMTWFKCAHLVATAASAHVQLGIKYVYLSGYALTQLLLSMRFYAFVTITIYYFFVTCQLLAQHHLVVGVAMLHLSLLPAFALIKFSYALTQKCLKTRVDITALRNKCLRNFAKVQRCACHHCYYGKKFACLPQCIYRCCANIFLLLWRFASCGKYLWQLWTTINNKCQHDFCRLWFSRVQALMVKGQVVNGECVWVGI